MTIKTYEQRLLEARKARKKSDYSKKTDTEFSERTVLPSPGQFQWFQLPSEVFNFVKFCEYVRGGETRGKQSKRELHDQMQARAEIENYIRKNKKAQARYLVWLCLVGKLCNDAIVTLETKRKLDIKKLSEFAKIGTHSAFKADNKWSGDRKNVITDDLFVVWRTALEDLMFEIKTLTMNFVATYQLTEIPDYPKFPNP